METRETRGHRFKVKGKRFHRNLRDNFFTQKVVGVWNKLSEEVVGAGTIPLFKKQFDRHMYRAGLEGYGPSAGMWD